MKGLCYLVIGFALIVVYQQNPLGTIVFGAIVLAIYAYIKMRKRRTGAGRGLLWGKNAQARNSPMEDVVNLLLVQNLLGSHSQIPKHEQDPGEKKASPEQEHLDALKADILALLDGV